MTTKGKIIIGSIAGLAVIISIIIVAKKKAVVTTFLPGTQGIQPNACICNPLNICVNSLKCSTWTTLGGKVVCENANILAAATHVPNPHPGAICSAGKQTTSCYASHKPNPRPGASGA